MLADDASQQIDIGTLQPGLLRPAAWLDALIRFIAEQLPIWRDRSDRPRANGETQLTSQLCAHLNGAARRAPGWDILQFRVEEPDAVQRGRRIDLAPAPSGGTIWIDGRRYSEFDALLPIECKRLPTPTAARRDKREYLRTRNSSTGGVQRFKAGDHGADHRIGVMIAYIQAGDVSRWVARIDRWVRGLVRARLEAWTLDDRITLESYNHGSKSALLRSRHNRARGLSPIALSHLWIEL